MNKGSIIQEKEATLLFIFGSTSLYSPIESQGILVFYVKFEEVLHGKIRLGEFILRPSSFTQRPSNIGVSRRVPVY